MKKVVSLVMITLVIFSFLGFSQEVKYGGTLKFTAAWGPVTFNINPLLASGQSLGIKAMIYETLYYLNGLTGEEVPILAESYQWENDNKDLVMNLREDVFWTDGKGFTSEDVVFTFNLVKKYPSLDINGIWSESFGLESIESRGDYQVVFKFREPNVPSLQNIANQYIVPEHIWSKVEDPVTYTNQKPIGTGPFLFESFDSSNYIMKAVKNSNYWMEERPYIDGIEIRSVTSVNQVVLQLLNDEIDWGTPGSMDPHEVWVPADKENNKYWWPVTNTNILYLNTQKAPFNDAAFRKAVSIAIDKKTADERGNFGIPGIAHPTGIIPTQLEKWFDSGLNELANELNSYNPQKAQKILEEAGYRKDKQGNLLGKDGKILPTFNILVGAGWTQFINMARNISANLKEIGINAIIDQQPWGTYMSSLMTGTYDMAICWGTGTGSNPYNFYYRMFDPAFSATEIGQAATSGYSRYTHPEITNALNTFRKTTDEKLQKEMMHTIERIILEEVPIIPIDNRPENFNAYTERRFIGWPSAENPYAVIGGIDAPASKLTAITIHLK